MPDIVETRTWSIFDEKDKSLIPVVIVEKCCFEVIISPDATRADLEAVIVEMALKLVRLEGR